MIIIKSFLQLTTIMFRYRDSWWARTLALSNGLESIRGDSVLRLLDRRAEDLGEISPATYDQLTDNTQSRIKPVVNLAVHIKSTVKR